MSVKSFFMEALMDIDGAASSKRLTLLYLLILLGGLYIAHATCFAVSVCHADLSGVPALTDMIKVNLAAITAEHAPRMIAAFKTGKADDAQRGPEEVRDQTSK